MRWHNKKKSEAVSEDVMLASRLYYGDSLNQTQVAEKMGVDQSTVSRYLKRAREQWREHATQEVSEHVSRMMGEYTERLAYASRQRRTAKSDGDARDWFKEERHILKAMRDLLGVDGAKKLDVTSNGEGVVFNVIPPEVSDRDTDD